LGGKPNSKQPGLLQATIAMLPEGSEVVAAFNADEAGLSRTLPSGREGRILFFRFIFRRKRVKTGIRSCRELRQYAHHPDEHLRSDRE